MTQYQKYLPLPPRPPLPLLIFKINLLPATSLDRQTVLELPSAAFQTPPNLKLTLP